jgi:ParB/RepB/Spo0J family partition protein
MLGQFASSEFQLVFRDLSMHLIDGGDRTFSVSRSDFQSSGRLKDWIEKVGILVPLRVNLRSDGAYRIVSGFRRFIAAGQLGLQAIPCLVDQAEPPTLFLKAVVENLCSRGLGELEKATVIYKMQVDFQRNDQELIEKVLPILGIQGSRHRLDYYLRIAQLPEQLQQAISEGVVIPEVALKLSGWSSDESSFFVRTVAEYRLGRNKQRRLFELVDDLKASESVELHSVWEQSGAADIDRDQTLPPEVRYDRIRKALDRLRYPVLSEHQERFRKLKGALKLPGSVRLEVPEYFEGDSIMVSFRTRNSEEFAQVTEHLSRAALCNEIEEIFDLL